MSIEENREKSAFERYLSPIHAWALSLGCAVGWGAFVMPGTTFLPSAGPLGTTIGLVAGVIIMFIIGVNYHFLINKYPSSGGTLTYTIRTLGHDHGFMSAWFLILVYIAIIWANASAIGLISKNLFGSTFQFGFYYQFLGYDVYFGEVLLSVIAILICGFLCISNKRMAVNIQVILALVLILGISFCAFNALTAEPGRNVITKPYFAGGDTFSPKQVITIVALSPWAFVGFESISNSAQGFKFSTKKSLGIMTAALLCAVLGYVLLTLMATSNIDGRYTGWNEYIADLSNLKGVEGLPTFHAAKVSMGRSGVVILGLAALSGIMTGLIGNMIAASRLIYAMAEEGMLPSWFGELSEDKNPKNAFAFLVGISLLIPFLGRTAIGWIVDINTIGATIAYGYTSVAALINARNDNNKTVMCTGFAGAVSSALFFLYFMMWSAEAMSTESYLILAGWSILGFLYFRFVFENDREKRFGQSTVVWITLLFLIFFTSLVWVKSATDDMTTRVVGNISHFYEEQNAGHSEEDIAKAHEFIGDQLLQVDRTLTRNILVQMALNIISLTIMFSIYSIMSRREKQAEVETIKADERSRAKTVFLSNMSHDIRTPMNAIMGYINLAEDENTTFEELKDYLQKIKGSSQHLLALINDVLEMSRIESGKMELEPVPVNLKKLFGEVKDLFATQMSEKNISFSVSTEGINNEYVLCDKNRLNRVMLNLVSNSYKFTPEGGTISVVATEKISVKPGKGKYEIRIKDSGIGMSKEFASKVFDAFEREKDTTVEGIEGTGLGMSIVKSIIDMMGGNITVQTEKGKGTEFVISLELELQSAEEIRKSEEAEKSRTQENVDFSGKRVLLTDDMPINRQIATKLLEKLGFKVETAENGQDAVDKVSGADAGYYDVVLMDIQMPLLDGYEATAAIRNLEDKDKASVPIIAMTANAFAEDIKKASEAGMDGHIAKPIDVKNMVSTLSEILI